LKLINYTLYVVHSVHITLFTNPYSSNKRTVLVASFSDIGVSPLVVAVKPKHVEAN